MFYYNSEDRGYFLVRFGAYEDARVFPERTLCVTVSVCVVTSLLTSGSVSHSGRTMGRITR